MIETAFACIFFAMAIFIVASAGIMVYVTMRDFE